MAKAQSPTRVSSLVKRFPITILIGALAFAFCVFSIYETNKSQARKNTFMQYPECNATAQACEQLFRQKSIYQSGELSFEPLSHNQRLELAGWTVGAVCGGLVVFGDWVYISKKLKHSEAKVRGK